MKTSVEDAVLKPLSSDFYFKLILHFNTFLLVIYYLNLIHTRILQRVTICVMNPILKTSE